MELNYRYLQVDNNKNYILNEENREIEITFSSSNPVLMRTRNGNFEEILDHSPGQYDFSKIDGHGVVFLNHNKQGNGQIGRITRAWQENGYGKAIIRLSKRQSGVISDVWTDIKDGIITGISAGYLYKRKPEVIRKSENGNPMLLRSSWIPYEISILTEPPADMSVGIGRSFLDLKEDLNIMSDVKDDKTVETPPDNSSRSLNQSSQIDVEAIRRQAFEEGQKALLERNAKIDAIFRNHEQHHGDLKKRCLEDSKLELDQVRQLLLEEIGKRSGALFIDGISPLRGDSKAEADNFAEGVVKGFLSRSGMEKPDYTNQWQGRSILEIAERSILLRGENVSSYNKREIISQALQTRSGAMSSSDLPSLFSVTTQKILEKSFEQVEEIYPFLTKQMPLSNFLPVEMVSYGATGRWKKVDQHGERTRTYVTDAKEQIKLSTFANGLNFTREMMINDQLGVLTDFVTDLGAGAKRSIGDDFIDFLTSNPTLSDGIALFHSSHKNLAGSGGAVNVTTLKAAVTAMAMHKGVGGTGSVLNLAPTILLVPKSDQIDTEQFVNNQFDPNATNVNTKNPFANKFTVYADARFDTYDTPKTNWYAMASPQQYGGIILGTLDGKDTPTLESRVGWQLDGIQYEAFIDYAFAVNNYRPLYMNPGV